MTKDGYEIFRNQEEIIEEKREENEIMIGKILKNFRMNTYMEDGTPLLVVRFQMTEENAEKMKETFGTDAITPEMYDWARRNKLVYKHFDAYELAMIDLYNHVKANGETNLTFEEFFKEYVTDKNITR